MAVGVPRIARILRAMAEGEQRRADSVPFRAREPAADTQTAATVAASAIGLWELLLPRAFASLFDLSPADLVIIRLAGAATLGFGLAGLLSLIVDHWPAIRIQTIAAITWNVAVAIASAIYLAQGGRSILGVFLLLAAGFLVLSLTAWGARAER